MTTIPTTAQELLAIHDAPGEGRSGEQIMISAYGLSERYPETGAAYFQTRDSETAWLVATILNNYQTLFGARAKYAARGCRVMICGSAQPILSSLGEFEPEDWQ